jgi:hypothetical protein
VEDKKPSIPSFEQIGEAIKQFGKGAIATAPVLESHWYIVVVGNIDFRQHTPLWYSLIGAINEQEFGQAQKTFLVNPPPTMIGFRFDVGDFSLNCQPDRWEIASKYRQKRDRMIDVASLVFKKLWEISVRAYGLHSQLNLPTEARDAQRVLSERMSLTGLGFPDFKDSVECQYVLKNEAKDHSSATVINITGSPLKKSDIVLTYVQEYSVAQQPGYYDIGEMIRPKAEPGWQSADDFGATIVGKINGFSGEIHAD